MRKIFPFKAYGFIQDEGTRPQGILCTVRSGNSNFISTDGGRLSAVALHRGGKCRRHGRMRRFAFRPQGNGNLGGEVPVRLEWPVPNESLDSRSAADSRPDA